MADAIEQRDFFISFNSADLPYAEAIDKALRAAGFTTFFHPNELGPGGNIPLWMENALMNSRQLLALCSPEYMADGAVYSEAERYAQVLAGCARFGIQLVPVELNRPEFEPLMSVYKRIDGKKERWAQAPLRWLRHCRDRRKCEQREVFSASSHCRKSSIVLYRQIRISPIGSTPWSCCGRRCERAIPPLKAVVGMGGIGKTTLAGEYCHRFGGNYCGVWWVHAEEEAELLSDLAALGLRLGIAETDHIEADARGALENLASRTEPWLMVYDNAPNADVVSKWLPTGAVRCLITSRFAGFDGIANIAVLDLWSDEVTADYLLARTGRNDKAGAFRLAHALGGLPLAAEQAAGYLRQRVGTSFDEYATQITRLLSTHAETGGDYHNTVYSAFLRSLETLKSMKYGEIALDVLRLCSFLSADRVDLNLLTGERTEEVLPSHVAAATADRFVREDALAALASLSLVRWEHEQEKTILAFHPLLLDVVRDWMSPNARVFWRDVAERLVKGFQNDGIVKENESRDDTQFIPDDAEIDCDDLGRGVLAIALARRLHKIWCKLNISIDQSNSDKDRNITDSSSWTGDCEGYRTKYLFDRDRDSARAAFVMHLDAPWGGGKTTFANFVAQVLLNSSGRDQAEWSFLRQRYGDVDLGAIFLEDPPSLDAPVTNGGLDWPEDARRSWITIRFNAWQMEHVSPPWWVFYQTIRKRLLFRNLIGGSTTNWTRTVKSLANVKRS